MSYWYPKQVRIEQIEKELRSLRGPITAREEERFAAISQLLARVEGIDGFPAGQIRQWVWIASQLRMSSGRGNETETLAQSAISFLERRAQAASLTPDDAQDLRWVLDSVVRRLAILVGPAELRACLDDEDRRRIDAKLTRLASEPAYDPSTARQRVEKQLAHLGSFSHLPHLATILDKVEALFDAAGRDTPIARTALAYLAEPKDAVDDAAGFLGLLDDVYVVEWAYAAIENHTRCLPILEAMLAQWPFVGELAFAGTPPRQIGRYAQLAACACLHALFGENGASVIVVRETGPLPAVAALMAALQCMRHHAGEMDKQVLGWEHGEPITISDGIRTFRATYEGRLEIAGGKKRYFIGVDAGKMTVRDDILPYVARAGQRHTRLSKGADISAWQKDRHADPLVNLTGAGRRALDRQTSVLLVGPRIKVDAFLGEMRPLGASAGALVGVRYQTSGARSIDLFETDTDTPFIYACADIETACELIRDPPDHVEDWRVIVDGARSGHALTSALSSSGKGEVARICVLSELHEREANAALIGAALPLWFIEDRDVEAPPRTPWRPTKTDDPLVRALGRQANHGIARHEILEIHCEFLEALADCARDLAKPDTRDITRNLDLAVAALMRKVLTHPVPEAVAANVAELVTNADTQAGYLRNFHDTARRLQEILRSEAGRRPLNSARGGALLPLLVGCAAGERVAIICRSADIAATSAAAFGNVNASADLAWMNVPRLRNTAPYDRIVVLGWLDRSVMRELRSASYADRSDYILYPFERRWFEATISAGKRWERSLSLRARDRANEIARRLGANAPPPNAWVAQEHGDPSTEIEPEFDDEIEQLETRAFSVLEGASVASSDRPETAPARLVLFEGGRHYAYLPPGGRVIVLSQREDDGDKRPFAKGQAERLLFRPVEDLDVGMVIAFPAGGDRDLLDARADQFLKDAGEVRRRASLWKTALKRTIGASDADCIQFAHRMREAGQKRDPLTVRSWIQNTGTIAPRKPRVTIPLIANLCKDAELVAGVEAVLDAVDSVYRARAAAAEAIVAEIFAGDIDLGRDELCFTTHDHEVRYLLYRVLKTKSAKNVPVELIGKVHSLAVTEPTALAP